LNQESPTRHVEKFIEESYIGNFGGSSPPSGFRWTGSTWRKLNFSYILGENLPKISPVFCILLISLPRGIFSFIAVLVLDQPLFHLRPHHPAQHKFLSAVLERGGGPQEIKEAPAPRDPGGGVGHPPEDVERRVPDMVSPGVL